MARRKPVDDLDLFGDAPSTSKRKRTAAPIGPALQGGPSGPAMKGGPSGPAMQGGPSGPAMQGDKKSAAPKTRRRSMSNDAYNSLF